MHSQDTGLIDIYDCGYGSKLSVSVFPKVHHSANTHYLQ